MANLLTSDEKISTMKIAGVAIGVAGAAVMIGPGLLSNLGGPTWAKFAVIGAAVSYAFAVVYAKRFKGISPTAVATGQLTCATVLMLPIVFFLLQPSRDRHVGYSHMDGGAGSRDPHHRLRLHSVFQSYRLGRSDQCFAGDAAGAGQRDFLGTVFLGEKLETFEFGGMILIMASLIIIDGRLLRR